MKKIILLLLLIPVGIYATENWDANVVEAFLFENSPNGDKGNYNLDVNGTPLYKTDIVKTGSYSYATNGGSNILHFPTTLSNYIGGLSEWTIEMWAYLPNTGSWIPTICMYGTTNFAYIFAFNDNTLNQPWWNGNRYDNSNAYTQNAWHHLSVQFDTVNKVAKWYFDQKLCATATTPATNTNVFNPLLSELQIGNSQYWPANNGSRFDKLIISNNLRNGVETTPVPTTPTITPTITPTSTFTFTPTPSFTATFTSTPTATPTSTYTPTPTVTPTPIYVIKRDIRQLWIQVPGTEDWWIPAYGHEAVESHRIKLVTPTPNY